MPRTGIFLTTFNRPKLVADAIASVFAQEDHDWHLYVLDDGSNEEARSAINDALGTPAWVYEQECGGGVATSSGNLTWWRGRRRTMEERRACIPYSWTICIALNYLLRDEIYVCYLVDDDFLFTESIKARADFLDSHPDVHVVYGRTRSIQYDVAGFNQWGAAVRPQSGLACPRPTGERRHVAGRGGKLCYFAPGDEYQVDPQTGLNYVEEGYWEPGWLSYGKPHMTDHNQILHRVDCLRSCRQWPQKPDGTFEYWGQDLRWGVGDYAFFTLLGEVHRFYGIDAWVCTKRFHVKSWGNPDNEIRE